MVSVTFLVMKLILVLLALCLLGQALGQHQNLRIIPKTRSAASNGEHDPLPYNANHGWGPGRTHEEIKQLYQAIIGENIGNASGVYSVAPASGGGDRFSPADIQEFLVETSVTINFTPSLVLGHLYKLNNPIGRFTVQQPGNSSSQGCDQLTRMTVADTAAYHNCRVSSNAGFFNPDTSSPYNGECLGNLVVSGVPVRSPGTQNANFGLLKNGSFVTGYIPQEMIAHEDPKKPGKLESDFETLIAGVVFLVKDGVNFVQTSALLENSSTQTTGSIERFIDVVTARTAIGHDAAGNLLLFVSDGATDQRGVDLNTIADLLIQFGAVNAINLDGGGSSTAVQGDFVVNYPTDSCPQASLPWPNLNKLIHCPRAVSSIVCLKDPIIPTPPSSQPVTPPPIGIDPVAPPAPVSSTPTHVPSSPVQSPVPISPPVATTPAPAPAQVPNCTNPVSAPVHSPAHGISGGWKSALILSVVVNILAVAALIALVIYLVRTHKTSNPYQQLSSDVN